MTIQHAINLLKLRNFRNYKDTTLKLNTKPIILLHGKNGAGKTNVLEALSLLSPFRSLRSSAWTEIANNHQTYTIYAEIQKVIQII